MTTTPRLGITDLVEGQAAPETSVNEMVRLAELGANHFAFISRTTTAEPGGSPEGQCYLLPASATGANWAGHDGEIARFVAGAWSFFDPLEGMTAWVMDTNSHIVFYGASWLPIGKCDVRTVAGTTDTLLAADSNGVVEYTSGSSVTVTIPLGVHPVGTAIEIHQGGAGTVTISPDSGVTLTSRGSAFDLAGEDAVAAIRHVSTAVWRLTGDIA